MLDALLPDLQLTILQFLQPKDVENYASLNRILRRVVINNRYLLPRYCIHCIELRRFQLEKWQLVFDYNGKRRCLFVSETNWQDSKLSWLARFAFRCIYILGHSLFGNQVVVDRQLQTPVTIAMLDLVSFIITTNPRGYWIREFGIAACDLSKISLDEWIGFLSVLAKRALDLTRLQINCTFINGDFYLAALIESGILCKTRAYREFTPEGQLPFALLESGLNCQLSRNFDRLFNEVFVEVDDYIYDTSNFERLFGNSNGRLFCERFFLVHASQLEIGHLVRLVQAWQNIPIPAHSKDLIVMELEYELWEMCAMLFTAFTDAMGNVGNYFLCPHPQTPDLCLCITAAEYLPLLLARLSDSHRPPFISDGYSDRYGAFSTGQLDAAKAQTREMFTFAYDNYMRHAFPMDELDPINCLGRGHDHANPSNININDVLGDYSLGLVDTLDSLVVFQNKSEFHNAVRLAIDTVSFDKNVTVQVFEATIRIIGSFLSAHLILTDPSAQLGDYRMPGYDNELLSMASDLASRLLPAFQNTATGLPYPRVNLKYGFLPGTINETCTAGAGSLLLEFGVLSRLLGDPTYESIARRVNAKLWSLRDPDTGLLGNLVNIQTGEWHGMLNGLGAGLDSFFEYMLKAYIMFGDVEDFRMFNESYNYMLTHNRRGRSDCLTGYGEPPLFVNVHMKDGSTVNTWIDALQASHAGVLILCGQVSEAICQHALYYSIWRRYDLLPERFNWHLKTPDVHFYPLRPEFAESTYLLYLSTKNPFYLHVGQEIINSLNKYTRVVCGFATVHNVLDKTLEDRMESFFLSETCKYLYLLFDIDNPVNRNYDRILFTTEGHILPIDRRIRDAIWSSTTNSSLPLYRSAGCEHVAPRYQPPLAENHLRHLLYLTGVCDDCF